MNRIANKIILSWVVVLLCGCTTIVENESPRYKTSNAIKIYNHTKNFIINPILLHLDVALKVNEVLNATTIEERESLEALYFPTTLIRVDPDPEIGRKKITVGNYVIRTNEKGLNESGAVWNIDNGYAMVVTNTENNRYAVEALGGVITNHNSINSKLNISTERTSTEKDFPYIYKISGNGSFNYDYGYSYNYDHHSGDYDKPVKMRIEFAFTDNTSYQISQDRAPVYLYKGGIDLKATGDDLGGDNGEPIKVIYGESDQYTSFVSIEFRGVSEVVDLVDDRYYGGYFY